MDKYKFLLRLPPEMAERLRLASESQHKSRNKLIEGALDLFLPGKESVRTTSTGGGSIAEAKAEVFAQPAPPIRTEPRKSERPVQPKYPPLSREPARRPYRCPVKDCDYRAGGPTVRCPHHNRLVTF